MNKKLLITISLICFAAYSNAQTLDEIIAKNIAARGGMEKLKNLKSLIMEASMNAQGQEIPMKVTVLQDKGFKYEMTMMGMDNYIVVNPKEGFQYFPIGGMKAPEPMPAEQLAQMKESFDIQGEFINTKEKGLELALQGEEDIEGTMCYKILCTRPSKMEKRIYIDKESFQVIKETTKATVNGKEMEQSSEFSNFKTIDGYTFAYDMGGPMGKTTAKKVIVNSDIPESFFVAKK